MTRRIISFLVLILFINFISCTSTESLTKSQLKENERVSAVVYPDGSVTSFDIKGGSYQYYDGVITGTSKEGKPVKILFKQIDQIRISQPKIIAKEDLKNQKISEMVIVDKNSYQLIILNEDGVQPDDQHNRIIGYLKSGKQFSLDINKIVEFRTGIPQQITKDQIEQNVNQITEIVYDQNRIITFDDTGVQYQKPTAIITGKASAGDTIIVNMDDIVSVQVKKVDAAKSSLGIFGLILLALPALAIGSMFN